MTVYKFGKTSTEKLEGADPRLQLVMRGALATGLIDISILQSIRTREKQDEYFNAKKSKVQWPNSKHNIKEPGQKSRAVDAAPYVNGAPSYNYNHCCFLAGIVMAVGKALGYRIRWGGNWDMDGEPVTDQDFQDLVHFEILD